MTMKRDKETRRGRPVNPISKRSMKRNALEAKNNFENRVLSYIEEHTNNKDKSKNKSDKEIANEFGMTEEQIRYRRTRILEIKKSKMGRPTEKEVSKDNKKEIEYLKDLIETHRQEKQHIVDERNKEIADYKQRAKKSGKISEANIIMSVNAIKENYQYLLEEQEKDIKDLENEIHSLKYNK